MGKKTEQTIIAEEMSRLFEGGGTDRFVIQKKSKAAPDPSTEVFLRHDNSFGPYDRTKTRGFKIGNIKTGENGEDYTAHMKTHWPDLHGWDAPDIMGKRVPLYGVQSHPHDKGTVVISHDEHPTHYLQHDGSFSGYNKHGTAHFDSHDAALAHAKSNKIMQDDSEYHITKVEPSGKKYPIATLHKGNPPR